MNDNRNYKFSPTSVSKREEYPIIARWIPEGSQVIDLGCGDGSLLALLKEKGVEGEGIEITPSGVAAARRNGVRARVGRIDVPLKYKDKEFDFATCNVTLQMVMYPEVLLSEMGRIAKKQIVSFPNFAFVLNRLELLIRGRMPRTMIPGYEWYSTGHIHQLSIGDFVEFCANHGIRILDTNHIYPERLPLFPSWLFARSPDLFASTAVFLTEGER